MIRKTVVTKRVVSPDGRVISEATSISVVASDLDSELDADTNQQTQTVVVNATSSSASSHSASSARCSR